MKNFSDDRVSFRIDTELKQWLNDQGGSKFIRQIVIDAYETIEKKEYFGKKEE